jgi:DNA polymerase-3 subunit epsilon
MPRPALDRREWAAALAPAVLLALLAGATAALLAATTEPAERSALWALIEPRFALVFMLLALAAAACGALLRRLWLDHGAATGRLAEQVQALAGVDDAVRRLPGDQASAGGRALAAAVNGLLDDRAALRGEIEQRIAEGSRAVAEERNRLAALMAELTQSVVVCNLDGRVLLFNARARLQFRALAAGGSASGAAAATAPIGGAEAIALGRSIYAVLDRRLVAHALEAVQQRLQRGAAHPSAQFVTGTPGGQLLRVQMAPVRAVADTADSVEPGLAGFVLMLDNITRDLAEDLERDRLLHLLTEGSRAALGNMQMAVELLDDPALDATTRERFFGVVREEIAGMSRRLNEAATQGQKALATRWPLEDMLGADFVAAAARRIGSLGSGVSVVASEVDAALWLRVDSFSLIQALSHLAGRLIGEYEVQRLQLRLAPAPAAEGNADARGAAPARAQLDLVWAVQALSTELVTAWETEPLKVGEEDASPLTVRDVLARHGGTLWFERARARGEAMFRLLLPLAGGAAPLEAAAVLRHESRPEFYDFDLFASSAGRSAGAAGLLEMRLSDLTFTVFDTETTGLSPSEGDEIIQIGATRIVGAKLRRQERFEQLVDPRRSLPEAGIAIHGIRPEMLEGQPDIVAVLPAFHAFAADGVLVAHNAAFDMRFLQLLEARTGVRFEQPVLDTLLLSAVLHPQQESHRLEAIAERLGVPVLGRHTALGDAIVTAEVFLKMLPLLERQGIATLGEALEASKKTWLARVSY